MSSPLIDVEKQIIYLIKPKVIARKAKQINKMLNDYQKTEAKKRKK